MAAPLAVALLFNALAFAPTLSMLLLVFWQDRHTERGRALFQFLGSLALFQGATFLTHFSLLADFPDFFVENCLNLTLAAFALVILSALALLIHTSAAMKDAWAIVCRTGVTALIVAQPALWRHGIVRLPSPLNETLFGAPYTDLGRLMVVICIGYIGLGLWAAQRYWRQINAPLLVMAVLGILGVQALSLSVRTIRELSLTAAFGGIVSGMVGYHLIRQAELDPRASQPPWLKAVHAMAQIINTDQPLPQVLHHLAEQARRMMRTDVVGVLLAIGPDRLELAALAGSDVSVTGRHVRIGEGLSGRVMQTLQPMRVDNYRAWDGRATDFDDMPFCASISLPLIFNGHLIGVLNASETVPGRTFTERDQTLLELLLPQIVMAIVKARLEHDLRRTEICLDAILTSTSAAVMIFDPAGILQQANRTAQRYSSLLFGHAAPPLTAIEFAARAQGDGLTNALVQWTINPSSIHTVETEYEEIGLCGIELRTVDSSDTANPRLLVSIHSPVFQDANK